MKSPHPFFSGMLALVLMFLMSTAYANESTEQQIAKLQKSARILFKQKKYEKAVNTSAKAFELARRNFQNAILYIYPVLINWDYFYMNWENTNRHSPFMRKS